MKAVVSTGSVNYQEADGGAWQPIDSSVVPATTSGYAWKNKANRFTARFKNDTEAGFMQLLLGGHTFDFNLLGAASGNWANPHGNSLDFPGVFGGVSLEYAFESDAVKETIVLADASVPSRYRFTMSSGDETPVQAKRLTDGSYAFTAAGDAEPLFVLAAPIIRDSDATARWDSAPVGMTVRQSVDGVFTVDLTVDKTWLSDPKRQFPVLVDPTIAVQTVAHEANFDFNCGTTPCYGADARDNAFVGTFSDGSYSREAVQFDLSAIPAGASVSSAQLSMYYATGGGCGPCASAHPMSVYKMTGTWTDMPPSDSSTLQYDPAALNGGNPVTLPANATSQWLTWNVTPAVQSWTGTSPAANYGLLIKHSPESVAAGYATLVTHTNSGIDPSLHPKLEVTYAGDDVTLFSPDTLHSTGAALHWTKYTGPSGAPFQKYAIHRSQSAGFSPTAATLLATIGDVNNTNYVDTTAKPNTAYSYRIVANTSVGNEQRVTLPDVGLTTKTLQPDASAGQDIYLAKASGAPTNCANNGADTRLWVGTNGTSTFRPALYFDLRDVPTGATITSARLSLWHPDAIPAGTLENIDVRRVTTSWVEGTGTSQCTSDGASWDQSAPGVAWKTAGGDHDSAAAATATHVSADAPTWDVFTINDLVQGWINGTSPNLGMLLRFQTEDAAVNRAYSYVSSDDAALPTLHPKLEITYRDGTGTIAPTVAMTAPAPQAVVNGVVPLGATASDDGRVTSVEFYDGATLVGTATSPPYAVNWSTTSAAFGAHTLHATAYDDAGNSMSSANVSVSVDNSALATSSLTAPVNPGYLNVAKADTPGLYWRLGESAGAVSAVDDSGSGRTGAYGGTRAAAGSLIAGDANTAMTFKNAAADGYVRYSSSTFLGGTTMTADAWVNYTSITTAGTCDRVLSRNWGATGGWMLSVCNSGGQQQAQFGVGTQTATAPVTPGAPMHLVGTYDGTMAKLYVNGRFVSSVLSTVTLAASTFYIYVGQTLNDDITIDEPAIYTTPLTAAQVQKHYDTGANGGPSVTGNVTLTSTASDDRNTVTKVEFYADNSLVATDAVAPYTTTWDTKGAVEPAYDGSHVVSAVAYDASGRIPGATGTATQTVVVRNAGATKYQDQITTSTVPAVMSYSPGAQTQSNIGVDVTIRNTSPVSWVADTTSVPGIVLRYRWVLVDPLNSTQPVTYVDPGTDIAIGGDLAANASRTLTAVSVAPPALPAEINRAQYQLRFDLFDKATGGGWFADKGAKPLDNPVIVNKTLVRGALGLERYYHYTGEDVGAGMQHLTNVANGNSLLRWTPWSLPGRGLATVVDLTYNALEKKSESPIGTNWSLSISGLTRFGNPIDIHPNTGDTKSGRPDANSKFIDLIDGDGTALHFTDANADGVYDPPAGVHLYVRAVTGGYDFTRPDRTTFHFDSAGFPTSVEDNDGNKITFVYTAVANVDDPAGPSKHITSVNDQAGRSVAVAYFTKADNKKPQIRGKIKSLTDHLGHKLTFDYYDDGNLLRITQGGGTNASGDLPTPNRSFVFTYTTSPGNGPAISDSQARKDPPTKTPDQSSAIYSVLDPRGNETSFGYLGSSNGNDRWKLASRTDRAGKVQSFAYDTAAQVTTVTDELSHATSYAYDTDGKVTKISDPNGAATNITWTTDRQVDHVYEPTKASGIPAGLKSTAYAYNDNGYLTSTTNQAGDKTTLTYEDVAADTNDVSSKWAAGRAIPHISQLATKTEPNGYVPGNTPAQHRWDFDYTAKGDLWHVREPWAGSASARPTTTHAYDANGSGDLATVTDPNNNVTHFSNYDANGLAQTVQDAKLQTTKVSYDADGNLVSVQDAAHQTPAAGLSANAYTTVYLYDSFNRLGRTSSPKSTEFDAGRLIWSAADYDPNDNVVASYAPASGKTFVAGAKTTNEVDVMDRTSATVAPGHGAGVERSELTYDAAGNLLTATSPAGVATTSVANDYTTAFTYDPLDRLSSQTQYPADGSAAAARTTYLCYDVSGDLRSITAPKAKGSAKPFTACPADSDPSTYTFADAAFTKKLSYDSAHRLQTQVTPLQTTGGTPTSATTSVTYDPDGNIINATDAAGAVTTNVYDERDQLVETDTPFDRTRTGKVSLKPKPKLLVSKFEYDAAGNRITEISPRQVDSSAAGLGGNYLTRYTYDALNQPTLITLPTDAAAAAAYVHYVYDALGRPISISRPVSSNAPAQFADSGSTIPHPEMRTRISYYDAGWVRTTDDPGKAVVTFDYDASGRQTSRQGTEQPAETWTYADDGLLTERHDVPGNSAAFTYDLQGNGTQADQSTGVLQDGEHGLRTLTTYNGFDEATQVVQQNLLKPTTGTTTASTFHTTTFGFDANGNVSDQSDANQPQSFVHDEADRLTGETDQLDPTTCADDRYIETGYTPAGSQASQVIRRRPSSDCSANTDPTQWPVRQQSAYDYFADGEPKLQQTWKGAQLGANLIESHTLGYETTTSSIDGDGDPRTVYVNGNQTSDTYRLTGPLSTSCHNVDCTATSTYNARDQLTAWSDGISGGDSESYTLDSNPDNLPIYTLDGNITSQTETIAGTAITTGFNYTFAGQIKDLKRNGTSFQHYFYNTKTGNLHCVVANGPESNCDNGANNTVVRQWYSFDALDRMTAANIYDDTGQMASTSTYTYDALNRVGTETETHSDSTANRTTDFGYLGLSSEVSTEAQPSEGADQRSYSYDAYGQRVGMSHTHGGQTDDYTYGRNTHGDISTLLGSAGAVTATYGYHPYGDNDGNLTKGDNNTANPTNPFRFNDKRFDSGSGSIDMGARRYDPSTARFLSVDYYRGALDDVGLATDPLTQNRYGFAGGNPINFVEVDGHYPGDATHADVVWSYLHPVKAAVVTIYARRAEKLQHDLMGQGLLSSRRSDNTADAFRHCCWMGWTALKYGQDVARTVGFNHEWHGRGRGPNGYTESQTHLTQARRMDLHNNAIGRNFASQIAGPKGGHATKRNLEKVTQRCLDATYGRVRQNRLWVLGREKSGYEIHWADGPDAYGPTVPAGLPAKYDAQFLRYVNENMDVYAP
jgi:RHS repeat-associated protein